MFLVVGVYPIPTLTIDQHYTMLHEFISSNKIIHLQQITNLFIYYKK